MINPIQNAVEAYRNAYAELLAGVERMTQEAKRMYFDACAQAGAQQLTKGHREAIKDAISTLAEKGIAWNTTANGARVPVDVGIRRVMANYGLNARMKQTREIAEEYGQDLVEVNTTANCRESHAEWQGGRYSLSGKSTKYKKFDEACHVGDPVIGIGGYNCQHVYAIWKEGEPSRFPDPLRNTDKSLEEVRALTSTQRRYEREIRAEKRKAQLLEQEGFEDAAKIAKAKIRDRQARLRKLIAENPDVLRRQRFREQVYAPKPKKVSRISDSSDMIKWPERKTRMSAEESKRLSEYAESKGVALHRSVHGSYADPRAITKMVDALSYAVEKVGPLKCLNGKTPTIVLDYSLGNNDFAAVYPGNKRHYIHLNERATRDADALHEEYAKLANDGFFVKGTDERAIVYHEIGHIVADERGKNLFEFVGNFINSKNESEIKAYIVRNVSEYASLGKQNRLGKFIGSEIGAEVTSAWLSGIRTNLISAIARDLRLG